MAVLITAAAAALIALFAYFELSLATVRYTLPSGARLKAALLTDMHGNDWGGENGKLMQRIRAEKPDVIFIAGDIVSRNDRHIDQTTRKMADYVRLLCREAPVYFVFGNHECKMNAKKRLALAAALTDAGAVLLDNQLTRLGEITAAGVNQFDSSGEKRVMAELEKASGYKLILNHYPQDIERYAGKCGAMLSGHTHGGQVRLPLLGGVLAPNQGFFPKYDGGRFEVCGTTLIISRGLGDSVAPIRLFNRHELVLLDFE